MVEQDLIRMRQQIATLQKELEKREQEQRSQDHVEPEEEKGACDKHTFRIWEGSMQEWIVAEYRGAPKLA